MKNFLILMAIFLCGTHVFAEGSKEALESIEMRTYCNDLIEENDASLAKKKKETERILKTMTELSGSMDEEIVEAQRDLENKIRKVFFGTPIVQEYMKTVDKNPGLELLNLTRNLMFYTTDAPLPKQLAHLAPLEGLNTLGELSLTGDLRLESTEPNFGVMVSSYSNIQYFGDHPYLVVTSYSSATGDSRLASGEFEGNLVISINSGLDVEFPENLPGWKGSVSKVVSDPFFPSIERISWFNSDVESSDVFHCRSYLQSLEK